MALNALKQGIAIKTGLSFIAKSDILCEVSIKEGQPTPKLRWLALFFWNENNFIWGITNEEETVIIASHCFNYVRLNSLWDQG